jgi:Probable sensor domain DACNV
MPPARSTCGEESADTTEMTDPAYPAARLVASTVHEHFGRHVGEAVAAGRAGVASIPDAHDVEAIIDAAFWASLRREETDTPKISLAFLTPEQTRHPLRFERPLTLDPGTLARVAPAVERPGIHLGVWRDRDVLRVWGTTRIIPTFCFVLEVASPGLLVIKHHRGEEMAKFVNVAVLEGDQIKVVDEDASSLPDCPPLLTSMLGFESPASWTDSVNVLVQLAVSMRLHRRGGSLLVVPGSSEQWRESIVHPIPYTVSPPFAELAELMQESAEGWRHEDWQQRLARSVDAIAGLTAVDGATVMTERYALLAFGVKIARRKSFPQIEQVIVTEPVKGNVPATVPPAQLGGTRHLSAAQFVQDQREAIALVASQDGRFTVFAWSPCEDMVHAHRVETLLL